MPDSPERLQFVEPVFVPDVFIDQFAFSQLIAPELYRFVFAVRQRCLFTDTLENVISAKLVMHQDFAVAMQKCISLSMGRKWVSYRV